MNVLANQNAINSFKTKTQARTGFWLTLAQKVTRPRQTREKGWSNWKVAYAHPRLRLGFTSKFSYYPKLTISPCVSTRVIFCEIAVFKSCLSRRSGFSAERNSNTRIDRCERNKTTKASLRLRLLCMMKYMPQYKQKR